MRLLKPKMFVGTIGSPSVDVFTILIIRISPFKEVCPGDSVKVVLFKKYLLKSYLSELDKKYEHFRKF